MSNSIAFTLLQLQKQSAANSKFYIIDCFNAGDEFLGTLDGLAGYSPNNFEIVKSRSTADLINGIADELEKRKQAQTQGQVVEERIVIAILNAQNCYELKPQQPLKPSAIASNLVKILDEGAPLGIHCIIHSLHWIFGSGQIFQEKIAGSFENKIFLKGVDDKIFFGCPKFGAVEKAGLMIVLNNKLDNEPYEQCKAYSDITAKGISPAIVFMIQHFSQKRNA